MDVTAASLDTFLERPMAPAVPASLAAVAAGEADPAGILGLDEMDRLLDPEPLPVETGWWRLADGTQQVAALTPMPGVTGEMIDWWPSSESSSVVSDGITGSPIHAMRCRSSL